MSDLHKEFGRRLRFVREMREMSQAKLAKLADVDAATISHFESGHRLPSAENLKAICKGAMVSADFLLGLRETVIP